MLSSEDLVSPPNPHQRRLGALQEKAGVPRGAIISNGAFSGQVERWEKLIGKESPELNDNTYEGNWATRVMIQQILGGQRKHDRSQNKLKGAAKKDATEGGEEKGGSAADAKPHVRKPQHSAPDDSDSESGRSDVEGQRYDEGDIDEDDEDDSGLPHHWAFAQLGPTLGNLVVGESMCSLLQGCY